MKRIAVVIALSLTLVMSLMSAAVTTEERFRLRINAVLAATVIDHSKGLTGFTR